MTEITCVVDARAELGEGTLWDPAAGVLWWIDIWGPPDPPLRPGDRPRRQLGRRRNTSAASASAPAAASS